MQWQRLISLVAPNFAQRKTAIFWDSWDAPQIPMKKSLTFPQNTDKITRKSNRWSGIVRA
jgi:hypothetical protein